MLKKMTIKNFKCFKNETVFDMKKTNSKLLEQNTYGNLLKGVLFVGDNASGKTTAILPLKLMLDLLFKDKEMDLFLYQCLFSKEKLTTLKFEFEIENHEIVYFSTKFEGNDILEKWFVYLKKSIYINTYSKRITTYDGESLIVHKYVDAHSSKKLNDFLSANRFDYSIQYTDRIEKKDIRFVMDEDEGKTIFFERKGIGAPIPLFMESMGNQTLINILPAVLCAVERGGLLIVDEFSSGLHNKLEELLVKYIMKYSTTTQLFFVSHSTNLLSNSLLRPDQIFSVEMMGSEGSRLKRFSDEEPRTAQNLEKMYLNGVFGGIPEYGIEINLDDFSAANEQVFLQEEEHFFQNDTFRLLSMLSCVLLDLGILRESGKGK